MKTLNNEGLDTDNVGQDLLNSEKGENIMIEIMNPAVMLDQKVQEFFKNLEAIDSVAIMAKIDQIS